MAIARACKKHDIELAQLYSFATSGSEPEWRVLPKKRLAKKKSADEDDDETYSTTNNGSS